MSYGTEGIQIGHLRATRDNQGMPTLTQARPTRIQLRPKATARAEPAQGPTVIQSVKMGVATATGGILAYAIKDSLPSVETITSTAKDVLLNNTVAQTIGNGIGAAKDFASTVYSGAQWTWWGLSWLPTAALVTVVAVGGIGAYCMFRGCGSGGGSHTSNHKVDVIINMPQNGGVCDPGEELTPRVKKTASKVDVDLACEIPQAAKSKSRPKQTPVVRKVSKWESVAKPFVKKYLELQKKMQQLDQLMAQQKLVPDLQEKAEKLRKESFRLLDDSKVFLFAPKLLKQSNSYGNYAAQMERIDKKLTKVLGQVQGTTLFLQKVQEHMAPAKTEPVQAVKRRTRFLKIKKEQER